jgi:hypothetical protein
MMVVDEGVAMTWEETELHEALGRLAAQDGGRRLLQLSLRGIETGDHELVSGCWTQKGDAGCLFQQAYWQGVSDGVFDDDGRVRAWVSGVAGPGAYHLVIDVIAAFDALSRTGFVLERHRFGPPVLDRPRWRAAVTAALVDVLGAVAMGAAPPVGVVV